MKASNNQIYSTDDIAGIIMPHNWDKDGKVTQIAIYTNKEEIYLVEHNQKEKQLLNYINRRVAVKGKILRGNAGNPVVVIKNHLVLAEDADDENDIILKVKKMPTYEFICEKCKKRFSIQLSLADYEKKKWACPKCKSRKVKQQITPFQIQTSSKS